VEKPEAIRCKWTFLTACASFHRIQCSNRAMDFIHKAQVPNYAINVGIES